jgi:hypothetical protein
MIPLRNLTLHRQREDEVRIARDAGFALAAEPEGFEIEPGEAGLRAGEERLAAMLEECGARGEPALMGGHTGMWVAAVLRLARSGIALPPLYCFDTRRVHDAEGRFIFVPEGLVRVC